MKNVKNETKLKSNDLQEMIKEELHDPRLLEDVTRTLHNCELIIGCFSDWKHIEQISGNEKTAVFKAVGNTVKHLDDLLEQIAMQMEANTSRRDPHISGKGSWSQKKHVLLDRRSALAYILERLQF